MTKDEAQRSRWTFFATPSIMIEGQSYLLLTSS
jgi:hypothetical protein